MNDTWLASLQLAHRWWVIPFGILAAATLLVMLASMIRKQPLPPSFLLLNRVFLIGADMQWVLGVAYWLAAQQYSSASLLVAFRHPILMTAVWFMYRYGNHKMKRSFDEQSRLRDGFAYYLTGSLFVVWGIIQIVSA